MEALVDGTAAARRTVWHQTGDGRQQGGQAEGDPGGAEDGGPGLAGHRLRPGGTADRPGDPGALPLPGRGDAGAVHGAGPGDHPHGVPARPAQRRARPALRGGGGAPAGRPDLQPVADPDGDGDAGPGRRGRDRHRPGQDPDPGDRVPARDRDPRLRAGRVSRGGGHGACRGRGVPDAARAEGPHSSNAQAAQTVLDAARDFEGPLGVRVEDKRQRPPRLHDLPSLQKLCSTRFGWPATKTLDVAQELYDGDGQEDSDLPARRGALSARERHR